MVMSRQFLLTMACSLGARCLLVAGGIALSTSSALAVQPTPEQLRMAQPLLPLQQSALALEQFTKTMRAAEETLASAGSLISDPRYQKQLQATLEALPELLNETRGTLTAVNGVIREVDSTVANLNTATEPLANQSPQMVARLNKSLANIETITADLAEVSRLMNENDGYLKRLATDPTLYRNRNSTSASLASLLQNLRPVVRDLQVFSDKVARHPELLGVRGIVRGSDGLKDGDVQPASFQRPKE